MNAFAAVVMVAWIPAVIGLFAVLPPRRAVITSFLVAWLFLPIASFPIAGLPDYTKMSATCVGALLGAALFDPERLLSFRPRLLDVPMAIWCVCPLASALSNDMGLYAGLAALLGHAITWGFPYLIGRVYLDSADALRELAIGIFIGGLVYVPLVVFEARMSPQLHTMLYGTRVGITSRRYTGFGAFCWMPSVFMWRSLSLVMFMASASVIGVWLWATGALRRLRGISLGWLVPALPAATVLCKSLGGNMLMVAGLASLFLARWLRSSLPLLCLLLFAPAYACLRTSGAWSGSHMVDFVAENISSARASSVETRVTNDTRLIGRALERPILGWGPWGAFSDIERERGDPKVRFDGLWIMTLGKTGLLGLVAWSLALVLPVALVAWRLPWSGTGPSSAAPAAAVSVVMAMHMVDCLFNAMVNPLFPLALGSLAGLACMWAPAPLFRHITTATALRINAKAAQKETV
ncbi:MAG TPA: O-antigen ligase domain-containing protein [Phycisphaerae bacterium]|nr:O-antigen ligase domain-containing protein [Phycisphaerae bacterium]